MALFLRQVVEAYPVMIFRLRSLNPVPCTWPNVIVLPLTSVCGANTISTSGYLEVTYEYNNKRTKRDKCAKTVARKARARYARDRGVDPPELLFG
ncbi:hypothetical protein EVAR_93689_1 [Eumeta japonica]|uniref:Uncharacterized protein n=1 Tax=Eumeta variegata TaxID=151549 RepID=A0A4C1U2J1_EUMVA|nr:hypothetical protein EVAR_93689_1 [Eumeta japonica]